MWLAMARRIVTSRDSLSPDCRARSVWRAIVGRDYRHDAAAMRRFEQHITDKTRVITMCHVIIRQTRSCGPCMPTDMRYRAMSTIARDSYEEIEHTAVGVSIGSRSSSQRLDERTTVGLMQELRAALSAFLRSPRRTDHADNSGNASTMAALMQMRLPTDRALMIGDTPYDMQSAAVAGQAHAGIPLWRSTPVARDVVNAAS